MILQEGDLADVTRDGVRIQDLDGSEVERDVTRIKWTLDAAEKGGFKHFTLKEIYEQPHAIQEALRGRVAPDGTVEIPELTAIAERLKKVERVYVVGCGTARYASDVGAFLIGRRFGKHKLAPSISPGKTVEGALGGWLCAIAMAGLIGTGLGLDLGVAALLGALVGVLSQVGDLCESALKRDLGVKDFGGLLPGHGGVLDRFDSLLLTAPVVYYLLSLWPR